MSTSARSVLFLGFAVEREDFIEVRDAEATCPEGHTQGGTDPFCGKDGGKFEKRPALKPTNALKAIHKFFDYTYDDDQDADWNYGRLFDDGPICSFENHLSWNHPVEAYKAAGLRLSKVGSFRGSCNQLNEEALKVTWARVAKLRKAMEMEDRPIKLYHELSMS